MLTAVQGFTGLCLITAFFFTIKCTFFHSLAGPVTHNQVRLTPKVRIPQSSKCVDGSERFLGGFKTHASNYGKALVFSLNRLTLAKILCHIMAKGRILVSYCIFSCCNLLWQMPHAKQAS